MKMYTKRTPIKASNEGRSDLIYVIMVNGNPVAKGSYDAMVKKSYTYNYPVQMLKFPKAKLNSLIKMAKDAHRPDPLKFAVNRFINDNTSEYDSLNSATKVRSRRAIKASTAPKQYEVAIDRGENEPLLVKFFDNKDDASKYADDVHDRGFAVRITDNETGETEELGEFESYWNTMTDVESCDNSVTASELSLNLNAKPSWEEWVAYGYDVNGEDVTTDLIDFQDDFRSFITDMLRSYPEIDTIDVYKRGASENDEYFQTYTRDDVRDMLADAVWNIQHGNVEASVKWEPVPESRDEETGEDYCYSAMVFPNKTGADRFIWIEKNENGEWNIINHSGDTFNQLATCKSLASAKRWVTMHYGNVESSVCASTSSTTNPGIIDVLEANGFESAGIDEPWWDKNLWLGFGCTYNAESQDAYVWWNPDGNMVELPYEYSVKTVQDANALCDDLYNWDEYYIGELLEVGLPLKEATKVGDGQYEYSDSGETAFIDVNMNSGYVIDAYGDKTEYNNLQDLLEEIGIIR